MSLNFQLDYDKSFLNFKFIKIIDQWKIRKLYFFKNNKREVIRKYKKQKKFNSSDNLKHHINNLIFQLKKLFQGLNNYM